MNIILYIVFAIEVVVGLSSTLYICGSLFWILGKKIFRKIRYGASLYD